MNKDKKELIQLLKKVYHEFVTVDSLYATDLEEPVKEEMFKLDFTEILNEIHETIQELRSEKN